MSVLAVVLILISAFMHAGWNVVSKRIYPTMGLYLAVLSFGILVLLPFGIAYMDSVSLVPAVVWRFTILAGFCQAVYFACLAGAYRHGEISVAYPVVRAFPVLFVLIISFILGRGEEISTVAVIGSVMMVVAAVFLPMRYFGELRLRNYINRSNAWAIMAALGTTGYSIFDDAALRILRGPEVLGGSISVTGISFFYLFFESLTIALWFSIFYFIDLCLEHRRAASGDIESGRLPVDNRGGLEKHPVMIPVIMGITVYVTYGLVLVSMAFAVNVSYVVAFRQVSLPIGTVLGIAFLRESGGWVRILSVIVIVFGLVLVAIG